MLATFKHEENRPQEFVGDGNDGALSSSPDQEPLKFGLEGRFGSTGRMGKLAEQTSDIRIAFMAALISLVVNSRSVMWPQRSTQNCSLAGTYGGHRQHAIELGQN